MVAMRSGSACVSHAGDSESFRESQNFPRFILLPFYFLLYFAASSSARIADRLTSVGMKPVSEYVMVTLSPPSFEKESAPLILANEATSSFQPASRNCVRKDSTAALAAS